MVSKANILRGEDVFARTQRIHLTPIKEADREIFFQIEDVVSGAAARLGVLEEFQASVWEDIQSENMAAFMIRDNATNALLGYCQFKNLLSSEVDLGIELQEPYRGKGLGYEVCSCMVEQFFKRTRSRRLFCHVYRSNEPSIHLIDKLGGVYLEEKLMKERFGDYLKDDPEQLRDFDILVYRIDRP